jgi:hypothetical protein
MTTMSDNVVVNGALTATGKGTAWPDGVEVAGIYAGERHEVRDVSLERVISGLTLRGGVLGFTGADADGDLGHTTADGTLDLVTGALDATVETGVRTAALRGFGVPPEVGGGGRTTVKVTGNLFAEALELDASGRLVMTPFTYGTEVRVDRLVADYRTTIEGSVVHLDADARLAGVTAYGLTVAAGAANGVKVDVREGLIEASGPATLTDAAYPSVGSLTTGTADWSFRSEGDEMVVAASLVPGDFEVLSFPGSGGLARIDLVGEKLGFSVDLDSWGREMVATRGSLDLDTRAGVLDHLRISPTPRQSWVDDGDTHFVLADAGLTDAHVALSSQLGGFTLDGALGTAGVLDAHVVVDELQLDVITELFPADVPGLAGVLDFDGRVAGEASAVVLDGTVDAAGVWIDGVGRWMDVRGDVDAADGKLVLDLDVGVAEHPLATVRGTVPVKLDLADAGIDPDGHVELYAGVRPGTFERLEWLVEDLDLGIDGRFSGVVDASGPMRDPDFVVAGVAEVDVPGLPEDARVELRSVRKDTSVSLWANVREGYELRAEVNGTGETRVGEVFAWALGEAEKPDLADYKLYVGDVRGGVGLTGMPVESLVATLGLPLDLGGVATGAVTVSGPASRPVIIADLSVAEGRMGTLPTETMTLELNPIEAGYVLNADLVFAERDVGRKEVAQGSLTVNGLVPLEIVLGEDLETWSTGDMEIAVAGLGLPLEVLSALDPGIEEAQGLVLVAGTIGGTPYHPKPDLSATHSGGEFVYAPTGVRYDDIQLDFHLDEGWATLSKFDVIPRASEIDIREIGELGVVPHIRVSGKARLDNMMPTTIGAQVRLQHALLVRTRDTLLRVSTKKGEAVTLGGRWPDVEVNGDIVVDRGLFKLDSAALLGAGPLELDPVIQVARAGDVEREVEAEEPVPSVLDMLNVGIGVDLGRNIEIEASLPYLQDYGSLGAAASTVDVKARAGGKIEVALAEGEIELLGSVDLIGGKARVLATRLDIDGGTLVFLGDMENPRLDIRASQDLGEASMEMVVGGTKNEPVVRFSSPEYPDQSAVLTMLITGRAPDQLGSDQGAAALQQALVGVLLNSVLAGASLGNVEFDQNGVRIGVPAGTNVYLETSLVNAPEVTENRVTVDVEYTPPFLNSVVLGVAVGDYSRWTDIFWELRF